MGILVKVHFTGSGARGGPQAKTDCEALVQGKNALISVWKNEKI